MERRDAILVEETRKPPESKKRSRRGHGARYTTGAPESGRSLTVVEPPGDLSAIEARVFGRS